MNVSYSKTAPSKEDKLAKAGQVIDFHFEGITIDQSVEITLSYEDGQDTSKIAIFYYNELTKKWEFIPSQVVVNGV